MAGERRLNFGADATDARYAIEDTGDGANFVLARDTDGGTVLLEWDPTAGEWQYGGPVDMGSNDVTNVDSLDANAVSTGAATIGDEGDGNLGPDTRPFSQVGETLVNVPSDYPTIQDALNDVPLYLRDDYIISIDDGDYSSEDLIIPPHVTADVVTEGTYGSTGILSIQGNQTTPANVTVNSVASLGSIGRNSPQIAGLRVEGSSPADNDENIGFIIAGGGNAQVLDCEFGGDGTQKGLTAYSGSVTIQNVDFGSGNRKLLMENKHGGTIWCASTGTVSGHATESVFSVASNPGISFDSNAASLSADGDFVKTVRSYLIDRAKGTIWPGFGLPQSNTIDTIEPSANTITPEKSDNLRVANAGDTSITTVGTSHAANGDTIRLFGRSDNTTVTIEHATDNIYLSSGANRDLATDSDHIELTLLNGNWKETNFVQF